MSNQQMPERVEPVSAQPADQTADTRKPYIAPAISHELALEIRAGSSLGPDSLDPDSLNSLFGIDSQ